MNKKDHHRQACADYYAKLIRRFGLDATIRRIPMLKPIIWQEKNHQLVIFHAYMARSTQDNMAKL